MTRLPAGQQFRRLWFQGRAYTVIIIEAESQGLFEGYLFTLN